MCQVLLCGVDHAAGGMAMRGSAPEQNGELEALCTPLGFVALLTDAMLASGFHSGCRDRPDPF
jgi:hypothetical protein